LGWAGKRTCMNALSSLTDDVQVTVWKRDMQREKVALYKHMVRLHSSFTDGGESKVRGQAEIGVLTTSNII